MPIVTANDLLDFLASEGYDPDSITLDMNPYRHIVNIRMNLMGRSDQDRLQRKMDAQRICGLELKVKYDASLPLPFMTAKKEYTKTRDKTEQWLERWARRPV